MLKKIINRIKYELQRFLKFYRLISDFNIAQAFQLSYFKNNVSDEERYLNFNPKKWVNEIKVRNSFRDKRTVQDVFLREYHLPINKINENKCIIVDLGCNIGVTIGHYKNLFPNSKIIGYEMDKDNYELAKKNTLDYSNIIIENKAIWIKEDIVKYYKDGSYDGYSLNILSKENNASVPSISMHQLIDTHAIKKIDYLKIDIEGTEKDILSDQNLDWLDRVIELNIEMHLLQDGEISEYISILENKGFKAWKDDNHSSAIRAIKKQNF
ncbi:MAG: FkbM family methyltransferase [Winogradskyella sp.]|uniref:FkbM family methyltransferase n=1 Tax=Winogradskyella sp. TaxID=1883156 RepID=UPI0017961E4E|nr:FkbM family methyltransferase [Winogradskyella sp.]MBT8244963.1 FkbM family methyltransferase [Winogradskyella sp.]NNK22195.1 FkbM family methyltransferase [Winogradskyella sp.]